MRLWAALLASVMLFGSGCGSTTGSSSDQQHSDAAIIRGLAQKAKKRRERAKERPLCPAPPGKDGYRRATTGFKSDRFPATIHSNPKVDTEPIVHAFSKQVSAWSAGNGCSWMVVVSGELTETQDSGFAIYRDYVPWRVSRVKYVPVQNAGRLKIIDAPKGASVETSAQERGKIRFAGSNGVSGTLDLSDDSVTLTQP